MLERLSYSFYRCQGCTTLLTARQIIKVWQMLEDANIRDKPTVSVCQCGNRRLQPTNLTDDERKALLSYRQLFRAAVLKADDKPTRVWQQLFTMASEGTEMDFNWLQRLGYNLWSR